MKKASAHVGRCSIVLPNTMGQLSESKIGFQQRGGHRSPCVLEICLLVPRALFVFSSPPGRKISCRSNLVGRPVLIKFRIPTFTGPVLRVPSDIELRAFDFHATNWPWVSPSYRIFDFQPQIDKAKPPPGLPRDARPDQSASSSDLPVRTRSEMHRRCPPFELFSTRPRSKNNIEHEPQNPTTH